MLVISKLVCLVAVLVYQVSALANLEEVFAWKELSFVWPNEDVKNNAIRTGSYNPADSFPLGMSVWRNKLFLTFPRWKRGANAAPTLGYVPLDQPINKTASIIPYPNFKANTLPCRNGARHQDEEHIISVIRVAIDACDRLWFVDVGFTDFLTENGPSLGGTMYARPTLYIYDLKTDTLLRKYVFDEEIARQDSFFANIVLDVNKNRCEDAYAYIPDLGSFAMVVYSLRENDSWRFKHHFFHIDPLQGDFNIGGVNFQWLDGLIGVALGPECPNGGVARVRKEGNDKQSSPQYFIMTLDGAQIGRSMFRTVYFHPMVSLNEFSVSSSVLRNRSLADDPNTFYEFKLLGTKGEKTQSTAAVVDAPTRVLFFTQLSRDGVACWNTRKTLKPENVALVATDSEKLIFTNDIRLDEDRYLWMISNKMPQFMYRSLNPNEINFRIYRVKVDDAIAGTRCAA